MESSAHVQDPAAEAPPLLRLLDRAVSSDVARSGLQGRVLFGVETQGRTWWWGAVFYNGRNETCFHAQAPEGSHASIVLGDRRACSYMGLPPTGTSERLTIRGNRALMERFLTRYLTQCSPLQARLRYQFGSK